MFLERSPSIETATDRFTTLGWYPRAARMTEAVVVVAVMSVQPGSDILTVLHSAGSAAGAAAGQKERPHRAMPAAAIRRAVLGGMFNLPVLG